MTSKDSTQCYSFKKIKYNTGLLDEAVDATYIIHLEGNGRYDDFDALTNIAFCAQTTLSPQNVIEELERIIHLALKECRPVFIKIPEEAGYMPVLKTGNEMHAFQYSSVPKELDAALA